MATLENTGTIRTLGEEKSLVTAKLGKIFKRQKFINADEHLLQDGVIAKILFKDMNVPSPFQEIWWNQIKNHVRKKLDERRSNCGNAIKKSLIGKYDKMEIVCK